MNSVLGTLSFTRFHRLWREFQKQNGFIGRAYGGQRTPASETHALLELEEQEALAPRQLAQVLGMALTTVTRTIESLASSGYVTAKLSQAGGRGKLAALTPAGREFLKGHHRRNERQIARITERLSGDQIKQLTHYFRELADGLGGHHSKLNPQISPFRREIIRLTRAHGLMRKRIFPETELNFLQWHILAAVTHDAPGASAHELCESLGVPVNTMSAAIAALAEKGLLVRVIDADDKRCWALNCTAKGRREVAQIEEIDARRYQAALRGLSPEQVRDLEYLWSKLVGLPALDSSFLIQRRISAQRLTEESGIQAARSFLLEAYSRAAPEALSGCFLHPASASYVLLAEQQPCAVLELWPNADGSRTLGNLAVRESVEPSTCKRFIEGALEDLSLREPGTLIYADRAALGLCRKAGVSLRKTGALYALGAAERRRSAS